jgi:cob(I)alamin adenosyltransferase
MDIYTKRGDKGETALFGGKKKVSKHSLKIKAIGAVDELNSYLGVVVSSSVDVEHIKILNEIQKDLLTIGSILAGSNLRFFKSKTARLERLLDHLEKDLPTLKNFIVPGGTNVAAQLQFARSLARRAEREVVRLNEAEKVKPEIIRYLNRLSDTLFMLARDQNSKMQVTEEVWRA